MDLLFVVAGRSLARRIIGGDEYNKCSEGLPTISKLTIDDSR